MRYIAILFLLAGCASPPKTHDDYYRDMAAMSLPQLCYAKALGRPENVDYVKYELARRYTTCTQQQVEIGARMAVQQNAADKTRADAALLEVLGTVANTLNDVAKARNQAPTVVVPAYKPPLEVICTTNGNITTCRER